MRLTDQVPVAGVGVDAVGVDAVVPVAGVPVAGVPVAGVGVAGVGVDAVDVARLRRVLDRRPGLVHRLFTAGEVAYATAARDPAQRLAARFAAKEATMKVLGVGIGAVSWHDVEVVRQERGRPTLTLSGRAERLGTGLAIGCWHLSLTHTALVAVATVLAERQPSDAPAAGARPIPPERAILR